MPYQIPHIAKVAPESYFNFSGGEVHTNLISPEVHAPIIVSDYSMDGFMALAQYVQMIRRYKPRHEIKVVYPYLPYARQDRWITQGQPFSLKIFADMLNALQLDSVTIFDPHSDVAPALINNCRVVEQWRIAPYCIPHEILVDPDMMFVSPDAGAFKKISKLITNDRRICIGTKHRGDGGEITGTNIYSPIELHGRDCVIIDDICDGGRTFIELAKALKLKGARNLYLYVTHGIFSKGFGELGPYFAGIYTTDSMPGPESVPDNLHITRINYADY